MAIQSVNPSNGNILKVFEPYDDNKVTAVLERAEAAFRAHKKSDFETRSRKMRGVAAYLDEHNEALAQIIVSEMGKVYSAARAEVTKCAHLCRYYAEHAEGFLQDHLIETEAEQSYVRYLPMGVILAVMPWNFPFWQVFRFVVPTLMSGNVGILKHASNVPQCALAIESVFRGAGFDRGEFQTVLIGSDKVADLIADRRVKAITLTGSENAGASVAALAGHSIKKTVLELGGNDPFIVMPSADLTLAVDLAVKGRVQNNGQTCIAAKRYIVHKDVYEAFKDRIVQKFSALRVGDPMDAQTDVGPLATIQIREDLDQQVRASVAKGAIVLCGCHGIEGEGNYYQPGVLENIPENCPAYMDELFGPVGLLFKVDDIGEAIDLANDTRFGLGSVICTQDDGDIARAVNEIESGVTFVNALVASDARMPFGGVKSSGYGRELSAEGLHEFMNVKTVVIR